MIPQNTTRIEDIPDISDLENYGMGGGMSSMNMPMGMHMGEDVPDVNKFLKSPHQAPMQSGMYPNNNATGINMGNRGVGYRTMRNYTGTPYENYMTRAQQSGGYIQPMSYENYMDYNAQNMGMQNTNIENSEPVEYKDNMNCPDIYAHVKNCPMCSNYFKKDNSLYIIIIIVLAVLCLLLLKKVLEL